MGKRQKESDLYPIVRAFLLKNRSFRCLYADTCKGNQNLGVADVVGVKHVGGDRSNAVEVIVVEVKTSNSSYGKKVGEALGYSLFGHRCYLASPGRFDEAQRKFAAGLGVGLLGINKGRNTCTEVLAAAVHHPDEHQMLHLLTMMGVRRCIVCGALSKGKPTSKATTSIAQQTPLTIHNTQIGKGRLTLCPECVVAFRSFGPPAEYAFDLMRNRIRASGVRRSFEILRTFVKRLDKSVEERFAKRRLSLALKGRNFIDLKAQKTQVSVRESRYRGKPVCVRSSSDIQQAQSLIKRAYNRAKRSSMRA